jgi:hypothetical protein
MAAVRIEDRIVGEHGTGHGEQPVADGAQRATVAVSSLAQFGIAPAAGLVMLDRGSRPVILTNYGQLADRLQALSDLSGALAETMRRGRGQLMNALLALRAPRDDLDLD